MLDRLETTLREDPEGVAGVREMRAVLELRPCFGVDSAGCAVDPALARGLHYYTGLVFETAVAEPKVGSLTGGGRYDELVGQFGGRRLPTVGTSLGLERILEVLEELHLSDPPRAAADVLVTVFDADGVGDSLRLGTELRRAGVRAEVYLGAPGGLRRQFGHADKLGIPVALVAGPDERARGGVTLRDMRSGEQRALPRAEVVAGVRRMLSGDAAA